MTNFLQLALLLLIVLIAAKAGGYLATKLGQPSVLGELIIGLILGPSLLDITNLSIITNEHIGDTIYELGELGVLLLMFIAGLELHISDLAKNTKVAAYAGILGVLLPVGLGLLVGELDGLTFENAMFLGLTLGATSVSISAQTLMEMKVLRTKVGLGLLGAAVFDDILVILLLSSFVALADGGSAAQIVLVFIKMIGFLGLSAAFGLWVLPRLSNTVSKLPISQNVITFALVIMLTYGLAAELIGGMAAITGTFVAGLMFGRTSAKPQIEAGLHTLSYAFFVPIFFVSIGLSINLRDVGIDALWLTLLISVVAVLGKILGAGAGARIGKFSWRESLQLGIGMVSRGEVGLIVAAIGLSTGHLTDSLFSAVVGMILITTLITPPLLRIAFKKSSADKPELAASGN